MKNILAVDTATKIFTISLKSSNKYFEIVIDEGFSHSENFIPSLTRILNEANIQMKDVELLICTRGPGSFTGLRISMATLKGITCGLNIPLVSIPTLDVYAFRKESNGVVLPIIDARKKSYYSAIYKNSIKTTTDMDISYEDLLVKLKNEDSILLTGPDAAIFYEKIKDDNRFTLDESYMKGYGNSLIDLGVKSFKENGPDKENQGPLYIRKSEAEILLENK